MSGLALQGRPMLAAGVVLLSGGLDSTAALMWARARYTSLVAVMFDYGQPNRDQELSAAGRVCDSYAVKSVCLVTAGTLPRAGLLREVEDDDGKTDASTSPAFVPGRNVVMLAASAAHASVMFPVGNIDLILGANVTDAKRYPDCRPGGLSKLGEALRHCLGRQVEVVTPWADKTKADILRSLDAEGAAACATSWSCYRGRGPCGTCAACVQRAAAFSEAGFTDHCALTAMFGGDPQRDPR